MFAGNLVEFSQEDTLDAPFYLQEAKLSLSLSPPG